MTSKKPIIIDPKQTSLVWRKRIVEGKPTFILEPLINGSIRHLEIDVLPEWYPEPNPDVEAEIAQALLDLRNRVVAKLEGS